MATEIVTSSQGYSESSELHAIWDRFLEEWPLEKLNGMTLEQYTSQGTDDSFCYWLESITDKLGSIWGGSSFKFGVYARKDDVHKESINGRYYSDSHGWMAKYGSSPEDAFASVKAEIVKVANAARKGDLETVNSADLGDAVRWKIAFLYQNRSELTVLPIFSGNLLSILTGKSAKKERLIAHKMLMTELGEKDLFDYSQQLWQTAYSLMAKEFSVDKALSYFDNCEDFQAIKPATKYIAGYESQSGKQIALVRKNKKVTLFLQPGDWLDQVQSRVSSVKEYAAGESRNSNLGANAPALSIGKPVVCISVESLAALQAVCLAYESEMFTPVEDNVFDDQIEVVMPSSLNQILYGPPGTGKTYATTEKAVELADSQWITELRASELREEELRRKIKQRYDELVADNRIAFTTFHQSFAYEDFIEGIRADSNEGKVSYNVEDGVFKALALLAAEQKSAPGLTKSLSLDGRRIWKMSLGNTLKGEAEAYEDCIEQAYIGLGWGGAIDFSHCTNRGSVQKVYSEHTGEHYDSSSYNVSAVNTFKNTVAIGDIVIVSDGNHKFRAIAEVTGNYVYAADGDGRYFNQCRSVRWLRVFDTSLPKEALFNKALSQMTLYELRPSTIKLDKLKTYLTAPKERSSGFDNYVLIIDEINRGNVSRIFGELITLLEPDKRKGGTDERSVILPYSKDPFSVPGNLYVLGTMNTADKSLAQMDLALRRRFEFIELMPDSSKLKGITVYGVDIAELLDVLNQRIEALLDRDHMLGHAYFWPLKHVNSDNERQQVLADIFAKRIIPLLQEYFFADWERIAWVLNDPQKSNDLVRFIELEKVGLSLTQLFPEGIASQIMDRRYRINTKAFYSPAAYQGILPAGGKPA
ncbi:MAG: AAA family ATPase [Idiomarina sp.]|nr:AAA family ATPase [Idiomarina sp.]